MRAELRGAEIGLQLAWDLGLKNVILEVDSLSVVYSIEGTYSEDSRHGAILHQIRREGLACHCSTYL
ncbi:hypothetical protein LINPERPRIM_LOCUS40234 [Linum perenne]